MKSKGKKRKINSAPAQGFPSAALPGARGGHASPQRVQCGGSPAPGEARRLRPPGPLPSLRPSLRAPRRGRAAENRQSPARTAPGRWRGRPSLLSAAWPRAGSSSPPLPLSPLGCKWPSLQPGALGQGCRSKHGGRPAAGGVLRLRPSPRARTRQSQKEKPRRGKKIIP